MDFSKVQRLGPKAYFIFLSKHLKYIILTLLLAVGAWYARYIVPESYADIMGTVFWSAVAIGAIIIAYVCIYNYLEYKAYTYFFGEEAFIVRYGYVVDNEVALMYHHIRNVNIDRYIPDRVMGVSQLQIVMVGTPDEKHAQGMVLPALDRKVARVVQAELLRRARKHFFQQGGQEI